MILWTDDAHHYDGERTVESLIKNQVSIVIQLCIANIISTCIVI